MSADQSADPLPTKGRNWMTLVLNANGLAGMEKRANFANLVEYAKPDAIIISETHLHSDVHNSESMPPGYSTPLQKDRDKRGGGVLIAVKDCYTITALNLPENDAEIVWGEVPLCGNKRLCLGAYYRTPSGDASSQEEALAESLKEVQKITRNRRDTTITLGGDFNFKDIDWNTESEPPGSYESTASRNLLDTLQNHHLSQMQKEPTRQDSVLDLYITNRPSLMKTITTISSISDHDGAILVDSDIVPAYSKKKPRKTFIFSKANWSKMKEDASTFVTSFLEALPETSVDENWEKIKGHLTSSMAKHIPSRTTSRKQHQPWITHGMKKRTRQKHRMYRKARKSGNPDHMSAFWDYKKQSAKEMKKAKVRYVNERVLGELEDGNTKPFYRYIKSLRMDNIGLPPLKSTNTLVTSALDKATILLNEFSSVFTHEDTTFNPGSVPLSTRLVKSSPKNLEWGSYCYVWSPTKPPPPTRSPTEYSKN